MALEPPCGKLKLSPSLRGSPGCQSRLSGYIPHNCSCRFQLGKKSFRRAQKVLSVPQAVLVSQVTPISKRALHHMGQALATITSGSTKTSVLRGEAIFYHRLNCILSHRIISKTETAVSGFDGVGCPGNRASSPPSGVAEGTRDSLQTGVRNQRPDRIRALLWAGPNCMRQVSRAGSGLGGPTRSRLKIVLT